MKTAVEFNKDLLEEVTINVTELCNAIAEQDKGLVTVTISEFHVCELRGQKYATWHKLAEATNLDIQEFIDCI